MTEEQRGPLLGLPKFVVGSIRPQRIRGLTPDTAGGPYPLIVFSPGFNGLPTYYTSLLEQIASHGFVVAAIWHPYTTETTVFPDGRAIRFNEAGSESLYSGTRAERDAAAARIADVWLADARFLIDVLLEGSADGIPSDLIASESVTAIGHSFGGQNAAALLATDDRVGAAVNMDGSLIHSSIEEVGLRGGSYTLVVSDVEPPLDYLERIGDTVDEWWSRWQGSNSPAGLDATASSYRIFEVPYGTHDSFATDLALLKPMFPFVIPREMVGAVHPHALLSDLTHIVVAAADSPSAPALTVVEEGVHWSPTP